MRVITSKPLKRVAYFGLAGVFVVSTFVAAVMVLMPIRFANAVADATYSNVGLSGWAADRQMPSNVSQVSFEGRNSLQLDIDNSTASMVGSFYRTEGVQKAVAPGTDSIKADLYVNNDWIVNNKDVRAGLWATGMATTVNSIENISAYPIVEFTRTSTYTGWRVWDSVEPGVWVNKPGIAFNNNGWNRLELTINKTDSSKTDVYINGAPAGTSTGDPTEHYSNIILNSYNYATSSDKNYSVNWSNIEAGAYSPTTPTDAKFYRGATQVANNSILTASSNVNDIEFKWNTPGEATDAYRTEITYPDTTTNTVWTGSHNVWVGHTQYVDNFFGQKGDGTYSYRVQARSTVTGLWSGWTEPISLKYDATAPAVSVTADGKQLPENTSTSPTVYVAGKNQTTFQVTLTDGPSTPKEAYIELFKANYDGSFGTWVKDNTNGTGNVRYGANPKLVYDTSTLNGRYGLKIVSTDNVGNSKTTYHFFTIDSVAPDAPQHNSPLNNAAQHPSNFTFQWSDVNDALEYEFQSSQDATTTSGVLVNGVWNNKAHGGSDRNFLPTSQIDSYGASGTWYWQVRAIDAAGNKSAWTSPWMTMIQVNPNTAPNVVFNAPAPADNTFVKGTVTINTTATDDYGMGSYYLRFWKNAYESGIANLLKECRSAPGAFLLGTSVTVGCEYDTTTLPDGTKIVASAQFQDGNITWGSASRTFTVDNNAPTISIKNSSASLVDGTQGTNPYHHISFKLYDAAGNLKEVKLNGHVYARSGQWNDLNWTNINQTDLIEGNNTIIVRDKAGNESSMNFVYDSTPPAAPILTARTPAGINLVSGGATSSYNVVIDWNDVTDANSYIYNYWNSIPGSSYTNSNRYIVNGLGSSQTSGVFNQGQGMHYMQVFAVDAAGNVSLGSNIFEVTYDTTAPTAVLEFPAIGLGAITYEVQYSEAVNPLEASDPANYFLNNWPGAGGSGDLVGDATVNYNPTTHKAVVTFTNAGWYVSPEQQWGVRNIHDLAGNPLNPAEVTTYSTPMVDPGNPGTPTPSSATSLTTVWTWAAATDANGLNGSGVKGYEYKFNGASDWTFTTNTTVTTTALSDGTYTLVVRAVDRAGNVSGEMTGNVTIDSTHPVISGEDYTTAANVITPNFTTTDSPLPTYNWAYVSGPVGGVVPSSTTILTPNFTVNTDGTYQFKLTATDAAGNETVKTLNFVYVTPVTPEVLGADTEADGPTAPATPAVTTFATTPTIVVPGFTDVAVLGDTATNTNDTTANNGNGEVEGASTLETAAQAVNSEANKGTFMGLAWYWWILIIAAVMGIAWWIIAGARKRQAE